MENPNTIIPQSQFNSNKPESCAPPRQPPADPKTPTLHHSNSTPVFPLISAYSHLFPPLKGGGRGFALCQMPLS